MKIVAFAHEKQYISYDIQNYLRKNKHKVIIDMQTVKMNIKQYSIILNNRK